ncbi:MAG: hypothetical protein UT32_C0001G0096 [Parcubacteria group bacterium GW2011_GWC2_39_14]|nr:MAG: hypothetical protein UT32_C0001G0096 [Parcubacteria group bacterium GW2011_GWC2_39_14]KKR55520.1 MAG: hypothetical protein UT91_C0001G0095 [Parcubacteria group bacterium GW2011_GWA2_40_23]
MHKIIKFDPRKDIVIGSAFGTMIVGGCLFWFLFHLQIIASTSLIGFWVLLLVFCPVVLVLIYVSKRFAQGEMRVDENLLHINWGEKVNCVFDLDQVNIEKWRATWSFPDGNRKVLVYKLSDSKNTFTFFVEISWTKYKSLPERAIEGVYIQVRDKTIFQIHPKFQIT